MASNEKKRILLTLTLDKAEKLERIAKNMGISKSAVVSLWVAKNGKDSEQKK